MSLARLYTTADVAEALQINAYTVRRKVAELGLNPARVGTRMRFTEAEVDRIVMALRGQVEPMRRRKRRLA